MKNSLLLLVVLGLITGPHPAKAFSTQPAPTTSDGAPKFTDPDEQMPNFMSDSASGQSEGLRPIPFAANPVTPPSAGEYDEGAAAFNQAYSHLQNQK